MVEAEIMAASQLQGDQRNQAMAAVKSRIQENRARFDEATVEVLQSEVAIADNNLALAKLYAAAAVNLAPSSAPAHYVAGLVAASSGDDEPPRPSGRTH